MSLGTETIVGVDSKARPASKGTVPGRAEALPSAHQCDTATTGWQPQISQLIAARTRGTGQVLRTAGAIIAAPFVLPFLIFKLSRIMAESGPANSEA